MKYKNIIFFLCDSLTYVDEAHLYNNFNILKKYKNNIKFFNNLYSQGPYTEAAINPLLTSTNSLDYGGYFQNINRNVENIFEIAKKNNYYVTSSILNYCNNEGFFRGVDSYVYFEFITLDYIIDYRIKYLKEIYLDSYLNNYHINQMKIMFNSFFNIVEKFIDDYYKNKNSYKILFSKYHLDDYFIENYRNEINSYKCLFYENQEQYIYKLISGEYEIKKFKKPPVKNNKFYDKYRKSINKKCIKASNIQLIKSLINYKKNKSINCLINNTISKKDKLKNLKREIMYTINYTMYPIYSGVSFKNSTDIIETILKNKKKNNFIFMHNMDNHFPFNFFSYDINDEDLLNKEYLEFIDGIKEKNYYNKFYDLSLRYVSNKIDDLIIELEKNKIIDDTLLIITSDHGCSYLGNIYRNKKVANLYDETYKIPLIIYSPSIEGEKNENYGSGLDVIPTISDICELNYNKKYVEGISLLKKSREFVEFEFLGSGCPDITLKNREFAIRGKRYKLHASLPPNKNFSVEYITKIYDLHNDKNEIVNIRDEIFIDNKILDSEISLLINQLVKRVEKFNEFNY